MADLTFIDALLGPEQPGAEAEPVSEEEALDAYSRAVVTVAERLSPSVANLRVARRVRGGRVATGGGSGVVITPDGFMLTSAHVVAGTDGKVEATFVDGREVSAEVVGAYPLSDLAVLRSDAAELVSADSMQAYRGLQVLTNQPARPIRLVGIWPSCQFFDGCQHRRPSTCMFCIHRRS